MLCALTVRKLKPGKEEELRNVMTPPEERPPAGWNHFYALRNVADENDLYEIVEERSMDL